MSLTQIDTDFLKIKEKLVSENETFLKKFQNNKNYVDYKNKNKKSLGFRLFLVIIFCALVAAGTYFFCKYFPDYTLWAIIIAAILIMFSITVIMAKYTFKIKQTNGTNSQGYYNAVLEIENSYDKLIGYVSSINMKKASDIEKFEFYKSLEKVFSNISKKLSKIYASKSKKAKKLSRSKLDWQWLLKYLYNFGKFCYNKKQDCKSFIELLSI